MTEIRKNDHQINGMSVPVIEIWRETFGPISGEKTKELVVSIPVEPDELIVVIL